LVDAQLPPALARWLTAQGHDADHVFDVALSDSADAVVWEHAIQSSAVIVTKDGQDPGRPVSLSHLRRQVPDRLRRAAAAHDVRRQGAVQHQGRPDLSRLNRAHPQKHDVFVLDFMNDADTIQAAFADYYRTTILSEETDPNKLHDLKAALDGHQVYADSQVHELVALYLAGADRDKLDPILDACVATYKEQLDEDGQVDFKGKAKAFVRAYGFLASILPYTNSE
jgi:hypothetical protein